MFDHEGGNQIAEDEKETQLLDIILQCLELSQKKKGKKKYL